MKKINFTLLCFIFLTLLSCDNQNIKLVDDNESDYAIVVSKSADSVTRFAASELQRYIETMSGAVIPINSDDMEPSSNEIIIGATTRENNISVEGLINDGFNIAFDDDNLYISSQTSRGLMYGVYSLLDEYMGVRLFSADVEVIPQKSTILLPKNLNITQIPVITFRDTYYTPTNDKHYVNFHKLSHDENGDKPDWGLWVHTFTHLVPPAQYYAKHPEYYSLRNGKRVPTQLCLSNPHVLEILCESLAKEMAEKPEAKYWSVSSDDNFGYCECDQCKKMDDIDGSPTGSVIQFVNKVAERFPDKIISTLAYQYSRAAPKVTIPANNVNIMFCNIECNRSEAIVTDPSSESFRKDMEDWAKITDNILVWDYVIQFKNLVSPFPNFHTLQPNIKYFVDNNVVALFEQGNREKGGEFADMRSYIISKLLWNPYANADSLMSDFCEGYYGSAGVYIKRYINQMTANLQANGAQLTIFGSPCDAANSYLKTTYLETYNNLFDQAEIAVANDSVLLRRVKIARQPLGYAYLEQAKLDPYAQGGIFIKDKNGKWITDPKFTTKLTNFIALCKDEGVTRLSEWHTTPDEYFKMMSEISVPRSESSICFEKPVKFGVNPHPNYSKDAEMVLTNGILGSNDFRSQWLGWSVPKFDFTVDLGSENNINRIGGRFMQQLPDWIFYPRSVEFYGSKNGVDFTRIGVIAHDDEKDVNIGTRVLEINRSVNARYVKVVVTGVSVCPPWHGGAGGEAFVFMDELIIE